MKHVILLVSALLFSVYAQDTVQTAQEVAPVDSAVTVEDSVEEAVPAKGLLITGTPDSMSVKVDGQFKGYSPLTITDLPAGDHEVVLTKKGFYGKKVTTTIYDDSLVTIEAELRAPGSIEISSTPDSALVFLNKKRLGKTPFTASKLRPGDYSLVLLKAGHAQYDTTVTVESGSSVALHAAMISTAPVKEETNVVTQTTSQTTTQTKSTTTVMQTEDPVETGKKRTKVFAIIGSALFAAFLTGIIMSEASGD